MQTYIEIANPINLNLIVIGTFLGLSLGLFLLFNKSIRNKANIYLGLLVLVGLSYFAQSYCYRFGLLEIFPHTIGLHRVVHFLLGPLIYFYVRASIQKGFEIRPILLLHFLPFILDVILNIPFLLQDGQEKIIYLNGLFEGNSFRSANINILKIVQSIVYYIISIQLLFRYRKHLTNMTSSIDYIFYSWVIICISIHSLQPIALIILTFSGVGTIALMIVYLCFFLFYIAIFIATLVKPELFHAFPHQMLIPDSTEDKRQKYETSNLQADQKERFLQKLLNHIDEHRPYLKSDLTLTDLSEQTKIPTHYLSQVINEKLECNFIDFVNGYRIQEAKRMLTEEDSKQFTILAIAYDAGFNSKSTFYTAFKKHTNMTPSAFRKSLVAK